MMPFRNEIERVVNQIIEKYKPEQIILFGSCASGCASSSSDIDLCVIMEYEDKQKTLEEMLLSIDSERDVDLILYRPKEWASYKKDNGCFAGIINRKGVIMYG